MSSSSSKNSNDSRVKILESRQIYAGTSITLGVERFRLPNEITINKEIVIFPEVVAIAPLLSDSRIILIEQYRYPIRKVLFEIPAGKMRRYEDPLSTAKRELEEETGYRASKLEEILRFYPAPGYSTELIHLYRATNLSLVRPRPAEDELIKVRAMDLEEALSGIADGSIMDAKTIIAIQRMTKGS